MTATSVANSSVSQTSSVSVSTLLIAVNPASAGIPVSGTQQFTVSVKGDSTNSVTWSVQEGAAGGTIDASGLYQGPAVSGQFHVIATSTLDPTQSATAGVLTSTAPAVGAAGGMVTDATSGISIALPPGAVDSNTVVTVQATDQAPPANINAVSPVYSFQPDGRVFARPLTISLPLPAGVTNASVYWSRVDGSGFDSIGGTIAGGMITVQIPHFSQAVIGPPSATRAVSGVGQTTWVSATSRITEAIDYSEARIEALVDDGTGTGTLVSYPGEGSVNGSFLIPNVPTGAYLLHAGGSYVYTDSSAPDLGSLSGGYPAHLNTPLTASSVLNLTINNLTAWVNPYDYFEFAATEANDWDFGTDRFAEPSAGATSTTLPFDVYQANGEQVNSLILGSRGDMPLLAQESSQTTTTGTNYTAIDKLGILPNFGLPPSGTTSLSVDMVAVAATNTISVSYPATQWASMIAEGNPAQNQASFGVFVEGQAGLPDDGFYTDNLDLLAFQFNAPAADVVTGPMGYPPESALPGTWASFFYTRTSAYVYELLPGTTGIDFGNGYGFFSGGDWTTTLATAASQPIAPQISYPAGITVAGADFYTAATGIGTSPLLSWTAPTIGTAAFYNVKVYSLTTSSDGTRTEVQRVANVLTQGTSLQIPAGVLTGGGSYVFSLTSNEATSPSAAQLLASAPFKSGIDIATSVTASAIFSP